MDNTFIQAAEHRCIYLQHINCERLCNCHNYPFLNLLTFSNSLFIEHSVKKWFPIFININKVNSYI